MKSAYRALLISMFVWSALALEAVGAEWRTLFSRVQSMQHGYHSEAEWEDLLHRLNEVRSEARRDGRHEEVIELDVLEAMIWSDLRQEHQRALDLLRGTLETYYGQPVPNVRRVYLMLANVHATLGDEVAITELIRAFQQSPHFDPIAYPFQGGTGPDDPLWVTRPRAGGRDSITVTSMQRARNRARTAPGRSMPAIEGTDEAGRSVSLAALRGTIVLVDFWFPQWTAWQRDLPELRRVHARYRAAGFDVVGIPLGRNVEAALSFARRERLPWTQWRVPHDLPGQLGIFGEARNFLVDGNGVIVARDLRASEVEAALSVLLP